MGFFAYPIFFIITILSLGVKWTLCANFTIINDCKETIWPGILANINTTAGDGFSLKPGQSAVFDAPPNWGGRIWGRTGCNFDGDGKGSCQTGGCGSSLKCNSPGNPPVSIVQITLGDLDYYDVSLVDGFNLPIVIQPVNGKGNCSAAGCDGDLRRNCPSNLAEKSSDGETVVGCKSACNVFDADEYCCRGTYSEPATCVPTNYSRVFKQACPIAYSYAYDDPTSIITCSARDYIITFCSSRNHTQCEYHNNQLKCSESNGQDSILMIRWILLISSLLFTIVNFSFTF